MFLFARLCTVYASNFLAIALALCWSTSSLAENEASGFDVTLRGVFKTSAVLYINEVQYVLKESEQSPEGVRLIDVRRKSAIIEIDGQRKEIALNKSIGAHYRNAEKRSIRFSPKANGHYFGEATINGSRVEFMVDTGASAVVMNSNQAKRIGIRYQKGRRTHVSTAQGRSPAFVTTLKSIDVGGIRVQNVELIVIEGGFPEVTLLGNSFLQHVNMQVEDSILVLEAKY